MLLKKEVIEFLFTTRCKSVTDLRRRVCSCQALSAARCSLKGEPELKSIKEIHVTCSLPRLGGSIHVRSRSCLQLTDPACDSNLADREVKTFGNGDSSLTRFVCRECQLLIGGISKPTHSIDSINPTQEYNLASINLCFQVLLVVLLR